MDKYEFSLKIEQLKKLVHEEDYYTALRIVNGIDWKRVRNTNLLLMAATVYEKNERLQDAKDILEQAYKRAPNGKRILFKLCELSVETADIKTAEDYYYEFRQVDPEDINLYLLQYMILKGRHAPYDKQLEPLELFCREDTEERWLYELAVVYDNAGRTNDCVRICDRIALMFGDSPYGLKALKLKTKYSVLSDVQKEMFYSKGHWTGDRQEYLSNDRYADGNDEYGDRYSERYLDTYADQYADRRSLDHSLEGTVGRGTERSYSKIRYEDYGLMEEPDPGQTGVIKEDPVEEYENTVRKEAFARKNSDALALARYENEDADFEAFLINSGLEGDNGIKEDTENNIKASMKEPGQDEDNDLPQGEGETKIASAEAKKEDLSDESRQMEFDFGGDVPKVVEPISSRTENKVEINEDGKTSDTLKDSATAHQPLTAKENEGAGSLNFKTPINNLAFNDSFQTDDKNALAGIDGSPEQAGKAPNPIPKPTLVPVLEPSPKPTINPTLRSTSNPTLKQMSPPVIIDRAKEGRGHHFIVETGDSSTGLRIAINELKRIHSQFRINHPSVKTDALKLNDLGWTSTVINRIRGKDFVIENAGSLDDEMLEKIYDFIKKDKSGSIVVFVDTPEGMDHIEYARPELFDVCAYVSDIENEDDEKEDYEYQDEDLGAMDDNAANYDTGDEEEDEYDEENENHEDYPDNARKFKTVTESAKTRETSKVPKKRSLGETKENFSNLKDISAKPGEEMESDDFAQYCMQYAQKIDCSISGTSMLALYERIELMEEDGVPLTKETAEQLIEEVADRAEKPPIGKRLKEMFHSKYDKNGCLILKESDFIY